MAEKLSSYLNKVMGKVSPAYAAKTWATAGSLFCLSTLMLAQDKMEFAHGRLWSTLFFSALLFWIKTLTVISRHYSNKGARAGCYVHRQNMAHRCHVLAPAQKPFYTSISGCAYQHLRQRVANQTRHHNADQPRDHEAVVEVILADFGGTRHIEINGGNV